VSDLPRLLICTFDVVPAPTGLSRRMTEYLKGLSDRFNVVVLSAKTPDVSHIERYEGARLLRVPVGSGDLPSRLQAFDRAVRRQLESEEYALVHFTDPFGGYTLCEQRESYGYRVVYEAIGFPSQELRHTHPQTEGDRRFISRLRRQELYCLMNAERVITGAPLTADFIHSLGVSREQITLLPAPACLDPVSSPPSSAATGARFLYLGSQVSWQGLPTLLRGAALALKKTDLHLVLVGPRHPDWQPHLSDLVDELHLEGKVEFQDPVPHTDLHKILATCDVGVLPLDDSERNRVQGGPCAKASDYFAGGRPVIASDLPLTRQLFPAGTAVFATPSDPGAWGERLVELATQPTKRAEMGRKARAHAEKQLDASALRGRLLDLYDALLGDAARRPPTEGAKREPALPAPAASDTDPGLSTGVPVIGTALPAEQVRQTTTEPDVRTEPPVVMGTPLPTASPLTEVEMPAVAPPMRPPLPHTPSRGLPRSGGPPGVGGSADPWLSLVTQGYCPADAEVFSQGTPTPPAPREDGNRTPRGSGARPRAGRGEDSSPGFKP
jgi:glycosyltransferase involved in cell wall biosynthesis